MKIIVTEPGKGKKANPHTKLDGSPSTIGKAYEQFEANNPELPAIDPNGQPLQPGEYKCKEIWQRNVDGIWVSAKPEAYGRYNNKFGAFVNNWSIYKARIAYQSIEAAVKPENICIICDEDITGKTFCADCGLNVADERLAPVTEEKERICTCGVPNRLHGTACGWINGTYSPSEPEYSKKWEDANRIYISTNPSKQLVDVEEVCKTIDAFFKGSIVSEDALTEVKTQIRSINIKA